MKISIKSINKKYDGYLIIWNNGEFKRGLSIKEVISYFQKEDIYGLLDDD
jgi:hypothetical protein